MLFLTSLYILSTIIKNKRLQKRQRVSRKFNLPVQQEIKAFAGEDEYSTNLDLARAYIEIGRNELALKLLKEVINEGTNSQKQEAQKLLVDI
jgi:FimV-like protein